MYILEWTDDQTGLTRQESFDHYRLALRAYVELKQMNAREIHIYEKNPTLEDE